jgi:hypothetical protein
MKVNIQGRIYCRKKKRILLCSNEVQRDLMGVGCVCEKQLHCDKDVQFECQREFK